MTAGFGQNNPPIAINDTLVIYINLPLEDSTYYLNLLQNDYDLDGDPIEIAEIYKQGGGEELVWNDSSLIKDYSVIPASLHEQVYKYRIREVNDTMSLSNWAWLNFNPGQCPDCPVALNDTVDIVPGYEYKINVLQNDVHPSGDSIFLITNIEDSLVPVGVGFGSYPELNDGYKISTYLIMDSVWDITRLDQGLVYARISHNTYFDSLDINHVNARFNAFGLHFQTHQNSYASHFKVPGDGLASTFYSSSIWIGGLDEDDQIHMAAERYRSHGFDFQHGPVSDLYDSLYDLRWFHVWKLNRDDLEYHRLHWNDPGYDPLPDILTWPGNGDVNLGQPERIAPFEDVNGNGLYEPELGDVPEIKGDQALFFVFNDARDEHQNSGGIPLGVEVHGMAYAFDAPEDSALWNTVFLHYDILNRSDTSYHDVYMGVFNHFMLGYEWDNYIESDVRNGMIICYNGDEEDQTYYDEYGYGFHPPAQGVMFLGGPFLPPDGIDNPRMDLLGNPICDESFNGLNFGDGIIDNERMGMSFINAFSFGDDPNHPDLYYNFLQGRWNDGSFLQYGGWGYFSGSWVQYASGPRCRYAYPGDSDPVNWGTFGQWPNDGYNQNGYFWTEREMDNYPNQRRGLGSCGPFDLPSGKKVNLDLAFPWARDYDGTAWESAMLLKERASYLRHLFETDSTFVSGIQYESSERIKVWILPNPTDAMVTVSFKNPVEIQEYLIYDLMGRVWKSGPSIAGDRMLEFDLTGMPPGHYILRIAASTFVFSEKIIKL